MDNTIRTSTPYVVDPPSLVMTLLAITLAAAMVQVAQAQTYTVLHSFTGGGDGGFPDAGLTPDGEGNLYGTTYGGGSGNCNEGCGTVFKLSHRGAGWALTTLYSFLGGSDSAWPYARVVFGPDGTLYGTTQGGSDGSCSENGCGTVFNLRPPATICRSVSCPWTKTVLYAFTGYIDGSIPGNGDLVFDQAGNIYGTTSYGGGYAAGTVFKLTRSGSGWTKSVLYSFTGTNYGGGMEPIGGVVFDNAGDLYGTTMEGGIQTQDFPSGAGVIFELSPAGSGWTENVLYRFMGQPDGEFPSASLTFNGAGSFCGTTRAGGRGPCYAGASSGCGTVFIWPEYSILYSFNGPDGADPGGPVAPATLDASGNLYGTTLADGTDQAGNVFEISNSGQYTSNLRTTSPPEPNRTTI